MSGPRHSNWVTEEVQSRIRALRRMGWTQLHIARFLGVCDKTVRRHWSALPPKAGPCMTCPMMPLPCEWCGSQARRPHVRIRKANAFEAEHAFVHRDCLDAAWRRLLKRGA